MNIFVPIYDNLEVQQYSRHLVLRRDQVIHGYDYSRREKSSHTDAACANALGKGSVWR